MPKTSFNSDELVILLGAGASVDAGIPDSNAMVQKVEEETTSGSWTSYKELYLFLRSSIFYADGIEGITGEDVPYNIERLVNVLDELRKKERHTLYPFVGAWNPKLQDVAGNEFVHVHKLRELIVDELRKKWIALEKKETANYYNGLLQFQEEYGHALKVFSLNYDLCVETTCGYETVQRGFENRVWDWRLFDEGPKEETRIFLYKLHGSLDWYFTDEGTVSYKEPSTISDDQVAMIFGTSYKLQYVDPFLYLAYELRRCTIEAAKLIVAIGYGFRDDHINGILSQALRQDSNRRILAVVAPMGENERAETEKFIRDQIDANSEQLTVNTSGAKCFLSDQFTIEELSELLPEEEDLFQEIVD